jgi:hypothetical protein
MRRFEAAQPVSEKEKSLLTDEQKRVHELRVQDAEVIEIDFRNRRKL